MSNVMPMMHRIRARNRAKLQERLVKQRLACRCGGTKTSAKMIVCLTCFQFAPVDLQRIAYSRDPNVRRVATRLLLELAERRKTAPKDLGRTKILPGGEPTDAISTPQRLKAAAPAPAGEFQPPEAGR